MSEKLSQSQYLSEKKEISVNAIQQSEWQKGEFCPISSLHCIRVHISTHLGAWTPPSFSECACALSFELVLIFKFVYIFKFMHFP